MLAGRYTGKYVKAYLDVTTKTETPFIGLMFEVLDGIDQSVIGSHAEVTYMFAKDENARISLEALERLGWNGDVKNPQFPKIEGREDIPLLLSHRTTDGTTYTDWTIPMGRGTRGKGASGAELEVAANTIKAFVFANNADRSASPAQSAPTQQAQPQQNPSTIPAQPFTGNDELPF